MCFTYVCCVIYYYNKLFEGRFNPEVMVSPIVETAFPFASPQPTPINVLRKVSYEENGPPIGLQVRSVPFEQI